jgi:ABC-type multidrug transport system fused ATPase/permease subunit
VEVERVPSKLYLLGSMILVRELSHSTEQASLHNRQEILANMADIREFTPESWRNRIGVVFQDPILFAGTVHDNIAYGSPDATRSQVEEAARQANCDFIWDLPQGFDTMSKQSSW